MTHFLVSYRFRFATKFVELISFGFLTNLKLIANVIVAFCEKTHQFYNTIKMCRFVELIKRKLGFKSITKLTVKPSLFSRFSIIQNLHRCAHTIQSLGFLPLQCRFGGSLAVVAHTASCREPPEKVAKSLPGCLSL